MRPKSPMKIIEKQLHNSQDELVNLCLGTIDQVGQTLKACGIDNNVNRHYIVGMAYLQKNRFEGEKARFEIKLYQRLSPLRKIQQTIDHQIDNAIDYLPSQLAKRAHKTHDQIRKFLKF